MIDINCDLGESYDFYVSGHDEKLMAYINSANIACGAHAGDDFLMKKTVENALKHNLNIGAHPGFEDKENFGRKNIELSRVQIIDLIHNQLSKLQKIAQSNLKHIKPHGALYNMSAARKDYAEAIAEAVYTFDKNLILYGLSGSFSLSEAEKKGLKTYAEVFADRAYLETGQLAPRTLEAAVLRDYDQIKEQIKAFVNQTPFKTLNQQELQLKAQTICIHSDTANALEIAQLIFETIKNLSLNKLST